MLATSFQSTGPLRDPTEDMEKQFHKHLFQSTGPLRDPTVLLRVKRRLLQFQSTGPLRDPTYRLMMKLSEERISIHRSLAGPDTMPCKSLHTHRPFQSTGPLRDPTTPVSKKDEMICYFNPQVPCGTRPGTKHIIANRSEFQSTGPLRDPTFPCDMCGINIPVFQSTGPLRDPTAGVSRSRARTRYFNPQVPCGTRRTRSGNL